MTEVAAASAPVAVEELVGGSDAPLVVAIVGAVAVVVFNRPSARNALSRDMRRDFAVRLAELDADSAVAAMVLAGAGGAFSAGVDIKESRAQPAPPVRPHPPEVLRALRKPVIAAVDGACYTGGLEIALAASFIVASERARFADTHAHLGLFPAWGMSAALPKAVGTRRARQMSLTGQPIGAAAALAWGLVNEVTSTAHLLPRALELAQAAAGGDPRSLCWQKALLDRLEGEPFATALAAEEAAIARWRAGAAELDG